MAGQLTDSMTAATQNPEDIPDQFMDAIVLDDEDEPTVPPKKTREKKPVKLRVINFAFVILTFILSLNLIFTDITINQSHKEMDQASVNHDMAVKAAMELELGSEKPITLPPKRSMAASKLKRVRVLGS